MRVEASLKSVLMMVIFILGLAAWAPAALADPENSSPGLRGSSRICRNITGAPLNRYPHASINPASTSLRKVSAPGPASGTIRALNGRVIPQVSGRNLMAPRSLRGALARVPRSTTPPKFASRAATAQSSRPMPDKGTARILAQARHYLGTPYRRGGSLENGRATDCSGFVQYVYQQSDIDLPRSSSEQAREGKVVTHNLDFAKMLPGDLLFFGKKGRQINHVGIYAGDGQMIHASNSQGRVVVSDLRQPYLEGSFVVAKRVSGSQSPQ